MTRRIPRVLLVGLGRFGRQHLSAWKALEADGKCQLSGAVCSSAASAERKAAEFALEVHSELSDELLASVDAVDVVVPLESHAKIIDRCLDFCDVFAEKPLAPTPEECIRLGQKAKQQGRVLMVNHLFRYHPVTELLAALIERSGERPSFATGRFVNPRSEADPSRDINLEFLHLADVLDFLLGEEPEVRHTQTRETFNRLSLSYPSGLTGVFDIGWSGRRRVRRIALQLKGRRIEASFSTGVVAEIASDGMVKHFVGPARPLVASTNSFLEAIRDRKAERPAWFPDAEAAARVNRAVARPPAGSGFSRPRIAVIGGGVFGGTCAVELAEVGDVVVYERHDELLTEASFANQWRHHSGFHYPRSYDTIAEIKEADNDFERAYSEIILPVDSYYATAASGQHITAERYLDVCRAMKLDFVLQGPPASCLDPESVTVCVKSDERVLNFEAMRALIRRRLDADSRLSLELGTSVVGARLEREGRKSLTVERHGERREETFDYVVNAAYANFNRLPSWLGLNRQRLRFDLCELVVLEIDMPVVSMTVLDGPFTSLVATGRDNLFILSEVHQSVLWSAIPADGLPPEPRPVISNRDNLIKAARRYFPILDDARFVESRYGVRTVVAHNTDYDARPTVVTRHGFGCWSMLGGKILTCVTNARAIAKEIRRAEGD